MDELTVGDVKIKEKENLVNSLEQELSRRSLSFNESQKKYNWRDIKNKLKPNEAYVELIRTNYYDFSKDRMTDSIYYTALITNHKSVNYPDLVVLEKGAQLEYSAFKYYSSFFSGSNKQRIDDYSYQNYTMLKKVKIVFMSMGFQQD